MFAHAGIKPEARRFFESAPQVRRGLSLATSLREKLGGEQHETLVLAAVLEHPEALFGMSECLLAAPLRKAEFFQSQGPPGRRQILGAQRNARVGVAIALGKIVQNCNELIELGWEFVR